MGVKAVVDALAGDVWDDLRFPASSINPAGLTDGASVITVETTFPGCLSFSGSIDNVVAGIAQLPHAWKHGSTLRPHIHWLKPTGSASGVTWEFYYRRIGNVTATAEAWNGPVSASATIGDPAVTNQHLLTSFGDVTMAGGVGSTMLAWRIYRRGSSDADNNPVTMLEFDIHYQIDALGSIQQLAKQGSTTAAHGDYGLTTNQ